MTKTKSIMVKMMVRKIFKTKSGKTYKKWVEEMVDLNEVDKQKTMQDSYNARKHRMHQKRVTNGKKRNLSTNQPDAIAKT